MEALTINIGKVACSAASALVYAPRCADIAALGRLGSVLLVALSAMTVWMILKGLRRV